MKITMETIRKAVLKHRGGLQEATDAQIKVIWDSLDEPTQQKYLQNLNETKARTKAGAGERKRKNAVST